MVLLYPCYLGGSWPQQVVDFQLFSKGKSEELSASITQGSFFTSSQMTFRVVVGDHNLSQNDGTEQYVNVQRIVVHPYWNSNNVAAG